MKTKKLINFFLFLLISNFALSQSGTLDQFFSEHMDNPDFTVVNVSPKMFQMISNIDFEEDDNGELKELIKGITALRILVKEEGDGTKLYSDASSRITKSGFEELLTVRDKGENVRFLVKEGSSSNIISQLVLLVGGTDNFVLLDLTGNINLKTIGKLGKGLDVPGGQHLEKLNKN